VTTGIFNHAVTAGQALSGAVAAPMSSSTSGTNSASDTSSSEATITANDFLTLLVTELQNQDPTADTDPNEYINQLVGVNSLEQLIDINGTLSTDLGSPSSTSIGNSADMKTSGATPGLSAASPAGATGVSRLASHAGKPLSAALSGVQGGAATSGIPANAASAVRLGAGNLNVPAPNAAPQRVAHALDGRAQ